MKKLLKLTRSAQRLRFTVLALLLACVPALTHAADLRAMVFFIKNMSLGQGHVGWAIETSPGIFCYGSIEGYNNQPHISPGRPNGGFYVANVPMATMLAAMKSGQHGGQSFRYESYKVVHVKNVTAASINAAKNLASQSASRGYSVAGVGSPTAAVRGNNCEDVVFDVIKLYSGNNDTILPWPSTHWSPWSFYDAICSNGGDYGNPFNRTAKAPEIRL